MSEEKQNFYFSAGVFKFDSMSAGFRELHAIAQEWAKDPNFSEIVVRKVAEDNYGIQFTYFTNNYQGKKVLTILKKELAEKFGKGFYAWDFHESIDDSDERTRKMVIKSSAIEFD